MPTFVSSVALLSSLLCTLFVHRMPLLSVHQLITQRPTYERESDLSVAKSCWDRPPPVWPHTLKVVQRRVPDSDSKVGPATTVTYYDYDYGGNLIQITPDRGEVLWDLELNSHHSFYFTPSEQTCKAVDFPVGILRPNWLQGATPLGPSKSWDGSGRAVCGWTKVDFIDYYVDATTGIPDSWYFHTMKASFQVLNYTENPIIDPALFVPPEYCNSSPSQ